MDFQFCYRVPSVLILPFDIQSLVTRTELHRTGRERRTWTSTRTQLDDTSHGMGNWFEVHGFIINYLNVFQHIVSTCETRASNISLGICRQVVLMCILLTHVDLANRASLESSKLKGEKRPLKSWVGTRYSGHQF